MPTRSAIDELRAGLRRQTKLERSGIRRVFTPHEPISSIDLFFGRQAEVQRIIDSILTPGQHAVLFGERGVGKSSLANVSSELLFKDLVGGSYVQVRCDSQSTFTSIAGRLLKDLGIGLSSPDREETRVLGTKAGFGLPGVQVGANTGRSETLRHAGEALSLTPSTLAAAVRGREGLLVIDEFDAVRRPAERALVAEFIKQLSDSKSALKVLVVGIGSSCEDLMAGHPSVSRCIKEVRLRRMTDDEIRQIIVENEPRAKVSFDPAVVDEIVHLSSGYPHFTQLIALKAAEISIVEDRKRITLRELPDALSASVLDAEETLRRTYSSAVRSLNTHMYVDIVMAAADLPGIEFTAAQLRDALGAILGRSVTQQELNNHFQKLVGSDETRILKREAKGVYRFSDPRMKSYVRLVARVPDAIGEASST